MMHCWPPTGNCTPLAKKEIIYAGPFGLACWLSGVVFIDRLNSSKARDTIEKLAERINRENVKLAFYFLANSFIIFINYFYRFLFGYFQR